MICNVCSYSIFNNIRFVLFLWMLSFLFKDIVELIFLCMNKLLSKIIRFRICIRIVVPSWNYYHCIPSQQQPLFALCSRCLFVQPDKKSLLFKLRNDKTGLKWRRGGVSITICPLLLLFFVRQNFFLYFHGLKVFYFDLNRK